MMKFPIQVFKFENFSYEEISISMGNLCVCYMDHVIINVKVQLKYILLVYLQQKSSHKRTSDPL